MELLWNTLPRPQWEAFHRTQGGSLQQSWAYGQAMQTLGAPVHRAAFVQQGQVLGLAQCIGRRLAGLLSVASCSRGPVWAPEVPARARAQGLQRLRRSLPMRAWRVCLISPDATAQELLPGELQGFGRVVTGYSTVLLDLRAGPLALRQGLAAKWRNRLSHAQRQTDITVTLDSEQPALAPLLAQERRLRQARGFHGLPVDFVPAYIQAHEPSPPAFLHARAQGPGLSAALADMLWLRHGRVATYHMGHLSEQARPLSLHNLLLWRSALALAEQGVELLDLGGVNTQDLPGISRFKLGTGGAIRQLAGTYF